MGINLKKAAQAKSSAQRKIAAMPNIVAVPATEKSQLVKLTAEEIKAIRPSAYTYLLP